MNIQDYLLNEIKRLNKRNDSLEKKLNDTNNLNIALEEMIQKNALAMCEIAKAYVANK